MKAVPRGASPGKGPSASSRTARLPNGCLVRYVSRDDVKFLYKEIYQDRLYLQGGVGLSKGDTVLDVGANIGLFSTFAAEAVGPKGFVLAAEPVPATFEALEANILSHRQWCAESGVGCGRVLALPMGLGDGSRQSATFTLYERAAGWGTMYPDEAEVLQDMGTFLENALNPGKEQAGAPSALSAPTRMLGATLQRFAPRFLYEAAWQLAVRHMLGSAVELKCQLGTVSALIDDYSLTKVDLLKVDVERAELEVLKGVATHHWPLIRQVVLEVHKPNLEGVLGLLRGPGGFGAGEVAVEQEGDLKGTSLLMVYCRRDGGQRY